MPWLMVETETLLNKKLSARLLLDGTLIQLYHDNIIQFL